MSDILDELQKRYDAICQRIEKANGPYSFLTERSDNGAPHVEFENGVYHHIVTERGLELERESFDKPVDLLYRLVSDTTFWMAVKYEFNNRIEGQDARRIMFAKWVELMERASAEYAEKTRMKIGEILKGNPYMS
jgi:Immunity protein 63